MRTSVRGYFIQFDPPTSDSPCTVFLVEAGFTSMERSCIKLIVTEEPSEISRITFFL